MSIIEKTDKAHGVPAGAKVELLPIGEVFADEQFNCRGKIAPIDVVDLARNIQESGLIQPITVRPYSKGPAGTKWQVVAGYRRHMAHIVNRETHIKAIIVDGLSDVDAEIINLSENLNRQDLNMLQEARAVRKLAVQGLTQKQMAERLRVSTTWINIRINVLRLPLKIQEEIEAGWIKQEHIRDLSQLNEDDQYQFVKMIKDRKINEGEKTKIKVTKASLKKDPKIKLKRDHKQISIMLEHILDHAGANFGTRCLAWSAGNISTEELYQDIKEICEEDGKTYFPPKTDLTV